MRKTTHMHHIEIRPATESDLETLFIYQLDEEANYLAAFTAKDHADKDAYLAKWARLLADPSIRLQTVLCNGEIAGSVGKYEMKGEPQITYGLGKKFWGQGIATQAVQLFLELEAVRPLYGHTAFDNFGSQKVLEKCGFKKIGTERGFANARGMEIEEIVYQLN
jgi:ribosomal-protein-alanine N-acetyltransferase